MPAQRLSMRQVREVLRRTWACGLSDRKIAHSIRGSRPTVAAYVRRAQAAGLSWPLPDALDETALERRLFARAAQTPVGRRPTPDWVTVHRARKRKGVALVLLWQEDKAITPDGLQHSPCCEAYRQWTGKLDLVMRQSHRASETLFVDSAGQRRPVVNALTGEVRAAALCIAVLGAANSPVAAATWRQSLPDWIGSHVRAFTALGGVPQGVVPDNLTAAVRRPHRDEPTRNRTYAELAQHDGVAIVPARAARPRDTAKVEVGVQGVERWSRARRRPHTCFSRLELNAALAALLVTLNQRPFKKLPGSRQSVCEALNRPALRPLPAQPYASAEWTLVRVNLDYHVDVEGHYSSVPYALVKQQLEGRLRAQVVAIFPKGTRVASHQRSPLKGRHRTVAVHMPKAHQHYAAWTPQRLMLWAAKTGEVTAQGVETILASRPPPQQGFRACVGLMRLGKRSGEDRLEAACRRALRIGACSYKSIASILTHDLDQQPLPGPPPAAPVMTPGNIRGAPYYHTTTGEPACCIPRPSTPSWRSGSRAWPKRSASRWTCRRARRSVSKNVWASEASAR